MDGFDEIRQDFKSLAAAHDIQRPLVANPDLGVMSWHKEFNILDLGMIGSPVMASLNNDPSVGDYVLDFAQPDFIESHGHWTRKYCDDLFLDPRFAARYRPAAPDITPADWCAEPAPRPTIWLRRAVERGAPGPERRFLDRLQQSPDPAIIKAEIDACGQGTDDCRYIMRTVFRFIPELRAQGTFEQVLSNFSNDVERAHLTGWADSSAPSLIARAFSEK